MTDSAKLKERLEQGIASLAQTERMIDLDLIIDSMKCAIELMARQIQSEIELGELKQEYVERISGMVRGIAAADRKRDSLSEAERFVETLGGMNAKQLVATYRQVSVRFRDCFSASFRPRQGVTWNK